jgi:membrane fusion protein, multidrug efflux system
MKGVSLFGLLIFGITFQNTQAQPAPTKPTSTTTVSAPAPTAADDRIRVQISSERQTVLSAEIGAKLVHLPLREGDAFRTGQVLAGFDCDIYRAQLNKAEASAEAARQTLKVNKRLAELGSISTLEVDQAEAKLKETEAEAAGVKVTLSKCTIHAPFDGRIAKVHVETHQFVAQSRPLVDIVDMSRLEVKLIVPSRWLSWVSKGTKFKVRVDDLNREVNAVVTRSGARIDPVNQTVSLVGKITDRSDNLLPGMSGWATFTPPPSR